MDRDDWWITRFSDNRVKGVLAELRDVIADCDDPNVLHKLRGSLSVGMTNYAATKERELRKL